MLDPPSVTVADVLEGPRGTAASSLGAVADVFACEAGQKKKDETIKSFGLTHEFLEWLSPWIK